MFIMKKDSKIILSIIIPCFNELNNISKIFEKIENIKEKYFEIILVNNGSTDETKFFLNRAKVNFNLNVINIKENIGYGGGIMEGVKASSGKIISWTHSDLQTDIEDVFKLYKCFIENKDHRKIILKGKRVNRNLFDTLFTFMMSAICKFYLNIKLLDINGQPKMFHRDFLKELKNAPLDFSLDLFMLYKANKLDFTIVEYPVRFKKRLYGESKGGGTIKGKINLIKRTLSYIIQIKKEN